MKAVWKLFFVLLLAVGGIFSLSLHTQAATKPYEYTFEKDSSATFNGVKSINKLVIKFDESISALKNLEDNIKVFQADGVNSEPINIINY